MVCWGCGCFSCAYKILAFHVAQTIFLAGRAQLFCLACSTRGPTYFECYLPVSHSSSSGAKRKNDERPMRSGGSCAFCAQEGRGGYMFGCDVASKMKFRACLLRLGPCMRAWPCACLHGSHLPAYAFVGVAGELQQYAPSQHNYHSKNRPPCISFGPQFLQFAAVLFALLIQAWLAFPASRHRRPLGFESRPPCPPNILVRSRKTLRMRARVGVELGSGFSRGPGFV